MIPLCLITGFLGAGKTTLLRRIARHCKDKRLVFLVNEFSLTDVDTRLLNQDGIRAVPIPGGSIFCKCLVTEFINHLSALPERYGTARTPLEGIIIEASGIADPLVIGRMLTETRLDQIYRLDVLATIVDPGSFLKLIHTLPNIRCQVEAAHVVIINKIDLCTAEEIRTAKAEITKIQSGAEILEARFCDVEFDPFGTGSNRALSGDYAACVDPNYGRFGMRFKGPTDLKSLESALRRAGDALYRAKGFVPGEEGVFHVDYASGRFHAVKTAASATGLECVVSGLGLDAARAVLESLPDIELV